MATTATMAKVPEGYWEENIYISFGRKVREEDRTKIVHVQMHDINDQNVEDETIDTNTTDMMLKGKIADYAFYACSGMVSINVSKSIDMIGTYSFRDCFLIKFIDLRATSVRTIDYGAFMGCASLQTIYFSDQTENIGETTFKGCINLQHITLPPLLKIIRNNCFEGCTKLKNLDLQTAAMPNLQTIGSNVFRGCINLEAVKLSDNIEEIGRVAFYKCTKLTSINLPTSLEKVGPRAFGGCYKLPTSITTNAIHFECDLNRGGRRYLRRGNNIDHHDDGVENDKIINYPSALWPRILFCIMNKMKLPEEKITSEDDDDDISLYTNAKPIVRHASIIYYILLNGIVMDISATA